MTTPRTSKNQPEERKEEEQGVQLFVLAYNPVTTVVSYQTDMPISKVAELVQIITIGQQRELARREVMAEIEAKKEKESKNGEGEQK